MGLIRAAVCALVSSMVLTISASAQGLLRDQEIETMLRAYANPILEVAGLDTQAVHLYIVGDPSMNAFVAGGQNIFIHTGIIIQADEPIEIGRASCRERV